METLEQKAIRLADELDASDQGRELIKGLIAQWQFKGFVAGAAGVPAHSKALWSPHHHAGYVLASKLSQGAQK